MTKKKQWVPRRASKRIEICTRCDRGNAAPVISMLRDKRPSIRVADAMSAPVLPGLFGTLTASVSRSEMLLLRLVDHMFTSSNPLIR